MTYSNNSLATVDGAKTVFHRALGEKEEDRVAAMAAISANRRETLLALQAGDRALGLSPKGSADVLEVVLGDFEDPVEAQTFMNDHLTVERQAELLQGRGDLPAIASEIASMEAILQAIHDEVRISAKAEKETDDQLVDPESEMDGESFAVGYDVMLTLRLWAHKLKDRADYGEFLSEVVGVLTIHQLLLLAQWHESSCPQDVMDVPYGMFDELGLDPLESQQELESLLGSNMVPNFDPEVVAESRIAHATRVKANEDQPLLTDDGMHEQSEAQEAADDIDL
jgi:hypothetical protein